MSSQAISRSVHCGNDCRQEGCPGHTLELEHDHASDTVTVNLDDQHYVTFDKVHWRALVNMERELRDRG